MRQAASILHANPRIAGRSLRAAAVLGDVHAAREMLTADPAAAAAIDDRGWPPLLYACYSRWHQADPSRTPQIAEVARLLLDAGASPNTNNGARTGYRSALTGSVDVNNPEVTKVLLEAGANPDDHQTIGWAAFSGYHRCLELLLSHAPSSVSWPTSRRRLRRSGFPDPMRDRPRRARDPRVQPHPGGPHSDIDVTEP